MITEEISVSDTCFQTFCGYASNNEEIDILCTLWFKTENAIALFYLQ